MNLLPILALQSIEPARSGAPLRVFASILLVALLCAIIYVMRHLTMVKKELRDDDLIPTERGARDNMLLLVAAITFVGICLLLFLIIKA